MALYVVRSKVEAGKSVGKEAYFEDPVQWHEIICPERALKTCSGQTQSLRIKSPTTVNHRALTVKP
jgi:hypothetical protein